VSDLELGLHPIHEGANPRRHQPRVSEHDVDRDGRRLVLLQDDPEALLGYQLLDLVRQEATEAEAGRAGLDGDFYLCAPVAFLSEVQAGLERKGVKPDRIHVESFGPVG
jgi:ferredoxin-NADP reductase